MDGETAQILIGLEPPVSVGQIEAFLDAIASRQVVPANAAPAAMIGTAGMDAAGIGVSGLGAAAFAQGIALRSFEPIASRSQDALAMLMESYSVSAADIREFTRWLAEWRTEREDLLEQADQATEIDADAPPAQARASQSMATPAESAAAGPSGAKPPAGADAAGNFPPRVSEPPADAVAKGGSRIDFGRILEKFNRFAFASEGAIASFLGGTQVGREQITGAVAAQSGIPGMPLAAPTPSPFTGPDVTITSTPLRRAPVGASPFSPGSPPSMEWSRPPVESPPLPESRPPARSEAPPARPSDRSDIDWRASGTVDRVVTTVPDEVAPRLLDRLVQRVDDLPQTLGSRPWISPPIGPSGFAPTTIATNAVSPGAPDGVTGATPAWQTAAFAAAIGAVVERFGASGGGATPGVGPLPLSPGGGTPGTGGETGTPVGPKPPSWGTTGPSTGYPSTSSMGTGQITASSYGSPTPGAIAAMSPPSGSGAAVPGSPFSSGSPIVSASKSPAAATPYGQTAAMSQMLASSSGTGVSGGVGGVLATTRSAGPFETLPISAFAFASTTPGGAYFSGTTSPAGLPSIGSDAFAELPQPNTRSIGFLASPTLPGLAPWTPRLGSASPSAGGAPDAFGTPRTALSAIGAPAPNAFKLSRGPLNGPASATERGIHSATGSRASARSGISRIPGSGMNSATRLRDESRAPGSRAGLTASTRSEAGTSFQMANSPAAKAGLGILGRPQIGPEGVPMRHSAPGFEFASPHDAGDLVAAEQASPSLSASGKGGQITSPERPPMTQVDPLMGQLTLISPPLDVASADAGAAGSAVRFDLASLVAGAGTLDAGGLAALRGSLPPGAQAIYPALPPGSLGPTAVNMGLAPSVVGPMLERGYGMTGASAMAEKHSAAGRAAVGTGGSGKALSGSIVPKGRPIGNAAGVLPPTPGSADPAGALGMAGKGQAQRGGPLDFLGVPVRLAPSLGGTSRLNDELAARRPAVDPGGGSVKPEQFNPLRQKLFPGFHSVTAEPDQHAWKSAAPSLGISDTHPASILSPNARVRPLSPSETRPQPFGGVSPASSTGALDRAAQLLPAQTAGPAPRIGATHTGGSPLIPTGGGPSLNHPGGLIHPSFGQQMLGAPHTSAPSSFSAARTPMTATQWGGHTMGPPHSLPHLGSQTPAHASSSAVHGDTRIASHPALSHTAPGSGLGALGFHSPSRYAPPHPPTRPIVASGPAHSGRSARLAGRLATSHPSIGGPHLSGGRSRGGIPSADRPITLTTPTPIHVTTPPNVSIGVHRRTDEPAVGSALPMRSTSAPVTPSSRPIVPRMTYAANRPARPPEHSMAIQRSTGGATTPARGQSGSGGGPKQADAPKPDSSAELNQMAQEVWSILKRRMSFEADRQGRF